MAASPGRTPEPRTVASFTTTSGSANVGFPTGTVYPDDVGRPISGTGIPAGATLATRASATTGTISANATATATITATLGATRTTQDKFGFFGWSPETEAEAALYPLPTAGAGSPSILSDNVTRVAQRYR
jgi:hypothetical protein